MNLDQLAQRPPAAVPDRLRTLVVGPDDPTWDMARRAWNLTADQQPAAVATPASAEDVVDIVNWARQQGLRVAAQGTGHAAAALAPLGNAVLVKTTGLGGVQIDAERRQARVGAGVLWGEVSEAAGEHGLAALAGSAAGVGVVGYTLGGGLSWLGRRYGLAANSVIAIELVTADGRHLRVDKHDKPDLFWALRGGGGAFGVVTALELELYPVAEVYAGTLFWPIEQAGRVLDAWRAWSEGAPLEMTSCARLLNLPPFPDIPEPLRGRSFVAVEVAHIAGEGEGAVQLRALRALGPEIDTVAEIPAAALETLHMDPEGPVPGAGDGLLLDELPSEAIAALVAAAGAGTRSPLLSVEIRQLGGALGTAAPDAGALASFDAAYAMFAVGIAFDADARNAIDDRLRLLRGALAPWQAQNGYLNFSERPSTADTLFPAEVYQRLRLVKATWDPSDVFLSNHPIVDEAA